MGEMRPKGLDFSHHLLFEALADRRRRVLLGVLDRVSRARADELATHVVAEETGKSLMDVTREEAEEVYATLRHAHLPKLEAANLISRSNGEITATQHPALRDPKFETMIETDVPGWDGILGCLADKHRRIVLSTLHGHDAPMDRSELAGPVARSERTDEVTGNGNSIGEVLQELHHVHLPALDQAGLIEYDRDSGQVSYLGHPELDEEWVLAGKRDSPRAILSLAHQAEDIWTLEGRENVTERGRTLCEIAREELFMMFTLEGMVETACVQQIRNALDRGVDVYLGTQNKELRDLVRKEAPEVTLWEPQLDWLNFAPQREKVGRLIMADRRAIMIGTVGDVDTGGIPREAAITGEGADNPLVMLLREMLGSRLDHLDAQSEDFLDHLPL